MNKIFARFLYWQDLGFDTSEYPLAGRRREARLRRLQIRLGSSYQDWDEDNDFMWLSIPGVLFVIATLIVLTVVLA